MPSELAPADWLGLGRLSLFVDRFFRYFTCLEQWHEGWSLLKINLFSLGVARTATFCQLSADCRLLFPESKCFNHYDVELRLDAKRSKRKANLAVFKVGRDKPSEGWKPLLYLGNLGEPSEDVSSCRSQRGKEGRPSDE